MTTTPTNTCSQGGADDAVFAIVYDDNERRPEIVIGRAAAEARFERISDSWNAHLFGKLKSNCQDDAHANNNVILAAPASAQEAPADPMDWPLPCDVTVGHGTMRKGVALRALVSRMKTLYEMATGNDADVVANHTPEERQALADKFLAAIHDPRPLHEQIAEVRRRERPSAELLNTVVGAPKEPTCSVCRDIGSTGEPPMPCQFCKIATIGKRFRELNIPTSLSASTPAPSAAVQQGEALCRLERAVDAYLGRSAWTQTTHLKGMAHSESVRKELYAAHDNARAALASAQPKTGESNV